MCVCRESRSSSSSLLCICCISWDKTRLQFGVGVSLDLLCVWQELDHLSWLSLKVCVKRKLESGMELGVESILSGILAPLLFLIIK